MFKYILKYQNDYSIWVNDKLDMVRFDDMIKDIEYELKLNK